ncbi:MAG: OB-fold nucleic acid binding domain-containing protein [Candidatus Bathyarchaeota archaeon]|nr:OB-fold nucleic acid binding domain-containing protein [Candidatus Bathyarchaeota archaeon]
MTTQDLIAEITAKNPQITQTQLLEQLERERARTNGLLGDETLLRLIAAKLGVSVQQNNFQSCGTITSGRLLAGLYDVNVSGRLIAVFPVKTFQGEEKSGKFATLMLGDCDGLLRVVLWNEKAELVERGELKPGQTVRLLHGYTREDRYGKVELHMGNKSQIEPLPPEKTNIPPIERFTTKIGALNSNMGNVHVCGTVKAVYGKNGFTRGDTDGVVMRLALRDDSGEVVVVVWNEKVEELERLLRESPRLLLINSRIKEANNGVEVHVDSNTFVSVN